MGVVGYALTNVAGPPAHHLRIPIMPHRLRLLVPLVALLGCSDPSGPEASPSMIAGTWELTSVDGCPLGAAPTSSEACRFARSSAVAGELRFALDGRVVRTVTYRMGTGTVRYTETGTVRLPAPDQVVLELYDAEGRGLRPMPGRIEGGQMIFRYPHPADGETVEVFTARTVIN